MKKSRTIINNRGLRVLITATGFFCTGLGIIGIFLPLLPTVPLLLLACACFARSSDRFYNWLTDHPHLGPIIKGYLDGHGVPLKAKITAIGMIWITIPISTFFFVPFFWIKLFLITLGLCVTVYLMQLPVRKPENQF